MRVAASCPAAHSGNNSNMRALRQGFRLRYASSSCDALRSEQRVPLTAWQSTAALQAGGAGSHVTLGDIRNTFEKALVYEERNGFCNTTGQAFPFFSDFLRTHAADVLPPTAYSAVHQGVQQYQQLDKQSRKLLLHYIKRSMQGQLSSVPQPAQARVPASGSSSSSSAGPGRLQQSRQQHLSSVQPNSTAPSEVGMGQPSGVDPRSAAGPVVAAAPAPVSMQQSTAAAPCADQPQAEAAAAAAAPAVKTAASIVSSAIVAGVDRNGAGEATFVPPPIDTVQRLVPVVIDLETSDKAVAVHSIVEIAAKRLGMGSSQPGASFQSQVRLGKGKRMHLGAEQVTGLTTEMMQQPGLPSFREAYQQLLEFLEQAVADVGPGATLLLIGHNIMRFDLPSLLLRAREHDVPLLQHVMFLDTLELAKLTFPRLKEPGLPKARNLQELYTFFTGKQAETAHRALADCETTEVVLARLMQWLGHPAGEDGLLQLLAQQKSYSGWVGSLAEANPTTRLVAKQGNKGSKARASQGAAAAPWAPTDWSKQDPLSTVEQQAAAEEMQQTYADLVAQREGWQRVATDPSLTDVFLNTPVTSLGKKGKRKAYFTPTQQKKLVGAGFLTLRHVLEAFPKAYLTPRPGQLPEEGEEELVICLPVRMTACRRFAKNGRMLLLAEFEPVHPSSAGLPNPLGIPLEAYTQAGRNRAGIKLKLFDMRHGAAHYMLSNEEARLRKQFGDGLVEVVQARVKQDSMFTDCWVMERQTFEVLPPEAAQHLFAGRSEACKPIYAAAGSLSPREWQEDIMPRALGILQEAEEAGLWEDPLPAWMLQQYSLAGFAEAVQGMHAPIDQTHADRARERFAFQELLVLQLKLLARRAQERPASSEADLQGNLVTDHRLVDLARRALPYSLTRAQQRVLAQILEEMASWPPMMCLLQGDVGCGKTIVAMLALLAAVGSGFQGAIMAPTEVLAEQHARNLSNLLNFMNAKVSEEGGRGFIKPTFTLLTGSVTGKERRRRDEMIADGSCDIVVGTHALISDSTRFKRLGLVIIDEQHKFGVEQRAKLSAKSCPAPHVLDMTATPIPRTVALVVHGDRTQVAIDELPPGRQRVQTSVLLDTAQARQVMYQHMREEMAAGAQVYIICPLVEQSSGLGMDEIKAAVDERERLVAEGIMAEQDCGLLHGRLSPAEKEFALRDFAEGKTKVLISTTVVEVGVDVPSASIIAVEHAERFGLAQLHQLRGRVGRGKRQSFCYLITDASGEAVERLQVLAEHSNGFDVAERDFEIRGAGEVLGTRQSGRDIKSSLKACRLPRDKNLLEAAREAAALHMQQHKQGPLGWSAELRACVADVSVMDLDISSV